MHREIENQNQSSSSNLFLSQSSNQDEKIRLNFKEVQAIQYVVDKLTKEQGKVLSGLNLGLFPKYFKQISEFIVKSSHNFCSICLRNFIQNQKVKFLPCKHIFHAQCMGEWMKISKSCPQCRLNLQHFIMRARQKKKLDKVLTKIWKAHSKFTKTCYKLFAS